MVELQEPYKPRRIVPLGLFETGGWRLKAYGVTYEGQRPAKRLVEAARAVARRALPDPAVTDHRYGAGFLGVHQGRDGNLVFLGWWTNENELVLLSWASPLEEPADLAPLDRGDPVVCVWDLRVVYHERNAWVEHVLAGAEGPEIDRYLDDVYDGWA